MSFLPKRAPKSPRKSTIRGQRNDLMDLSAEQIEEIYGYLPDKHHVGPQVQLSKKVAKGPKSFSEPRSSVSQSGTSQARTETTAKDLMRRRNQLEGSLANVARGSAKEAVILKQIIDIDKQLVTARPNPALRDVTARPQFEPPPVQFDETPGIDWSQF